LLFLVLFKRLPPWARFGFFCFLGWFTGMTQFVLSRQGRDRCAPLLTLFLGCVFFFVSFCNAGSPQAVAGTHPPPNTPYYYPAIHNKGCFWVNPNPGFPGFGREMAPHFPKPIPRPTHTLTHVSDSVGIVRLPSLHHTFVFDPPGRRSDSLTFFFVDRLSQN